MTADMSLTEIKEKIEKTAREIEHDWGEGMTDLSRAESDLAKAVEIERILSRNNKREGQLFLSMGMARKNFLIKFKELVAITMAVENLIVAMRRALLTMERKIKKVEDRDITTLTTIRVLGKT